MFCTITTDSHLFKTFALAKSLEKFGGQLKVLVIDGNIKGVETVVPQNVELFSLQNIWSNRSQTVLDKYKGDKRRWALKPVFLLFLLGIFDKLIYVDNDIYFFNDFKFLLNDLEVNNILLTPHFYPSSPKQNQTWLESNLKLGLYNAGFIGVNINAKEALEWWSDCCLYEMRRSFWRGLFDDQKYLDLFPVLFDKVKIVKNRGCNFAGWNDQNMVTEKGIVFIHFNHHTLSRFQISSSPYFNFFTQYLRTIEKYYPNFKLKEKQFDKFKVKNALYFLRWKLARILK